MKLTVKERAASTKCAVKQIRRTGDIPAILYSSSSASKMISIDGIEFSSLMREIKPGRLPTTIFTLNFDGKQSRAVVKDIQYHPTTYRVVHLDFEELHEGVALNIKVPITCVGIVNCAGIKLGGFLRQVIRHVKVECLPKLIPSEFIVDVKDLGINQSMRLSEIPMPQGVRPLAALNEVVVVIAKR
jgi:large subunit ribosomal protein L25